MFDTSCFGIYLYQHAAGPEQIGQRFVYRSGDPLFAVVKDNNLAVDNNPSTSLAKPDLEWTIRQFNSVREALKVPKIDNTGVAPFSIQFRAFCGSFQDDGVGEDVIPRSNLPPIAVTFPCQKVDPCGACEGDGVACACKIESGVPLHYDAV